MIQKIKAIMLTFSTLFILAAPLLVGGVASAPNVVNNLCSSTSSGINLTPSGTCQDSSITNSASSLNHTISVFLNVLSAVVGIVAVIMIIVAGLRYVSSGGNESGVKGAKDTILYAIIGLVIVALAQVIVHFVLNRVTTS